MNGHIVMPEVIEKKIRQRNYRFMEDCIHCHKTVFFDCVIDTEGNLKVNRIVYSGPQNLRQYFSNIGGNSYHEPHEAPHEDDHRIEFEHCQVCNDKAAKLPLCQDHTLEALLQLKFTDASSIESAIQKIKSGGTTTSPSITAQTKIPLVMKVILDNLQGQELIDFIVVLPYMIPKLKMAAQKRT